MEFISLLQRLQPRPAPAAAPQPAQWYIFLIEHFGVCCCREWCGTSRLCQTLTEKWFCSRVGPCLWMIIVNITIVWSLVHMTHAEDSRFKQNNCNCCLHLANAEHSFWPNFLSSLYIWSPQGGHGKEINAVLHSRRKFLEKRWKEKGPQNAWRVGHTGLVQVSPHLHPLLVGFVL